MHENEVWKPIPGIPDAEASSLGRIRKVVKQTAPNAQGYRNVSLFGKRHTVHQLVAAAFNPDVKAEVTRHVNGNPLDNRAENLRPGTHAENYADRLRHGRTPLPGGRGNGFSNGMCGNDLHDITIPGSFYERQGKRVCKRCQLDAQKRYRDRRKCQTTNGE